jgi:L-malate glycosyltransferase
MIAAPSTGPGSADAYAPCLGRQVLMTMDYFPGPDGGGTERQIWNLSMALIERGWEVGFLLLEDSDYLARNLPSAPRFVVGSRRMRSLSFWRGVRRQIRVARSAGFDVAHIWLNDCAVALPIPLALAGFGVISSRRDLGYWYTRSRLLLLRRNERHTAAYVCNASAIGDVVVQAERVPDRKIRVIRNGVVEAPVTISRAASREALGLDEKSIAICIVANLRPLKRIEDAIEALAVIVRNSPMVHLVIIGDTQVGEAQPCYQALTALVGRHCLSERVHFVGTVQDPSDLIRASDIGLLCSESEGLSNALIEYQLAGLPVICTDVGGNPEVVDHGITGLMVPVARPDKLAEALARLVDSGALRAELGRAGRESATSRFGMDQMVLGHESLYRELARVSDTSRKVALQ